MAFNGWTTNIIKSQIDTCANPHMDFKMSNLKPKICGWLHQACIEMKVMKLMMINGWEKTRLKRIWDDDFQLATLETNMTTMLFTTMLEIIEAINVVDDFDPTKKITTIME
jgi:hypothetical protein